MPVRPSPVYSPARLRAGLKPFRLHFFSRLRSTNDHAAALRRRGELFAPAVVVTPHQLAGRGRGSNTWYSTARNLTVTFAMPVEEHLAPHQLPLIAGLAVRGAAQELLEASLARQAAQRGTGQSLRVPEVQLKWPNDLLHGGRKLAGLLCERIDKVDLVGIGLNVNLDPADAPPALREKVTSLSALAGEAFDLTDVLIAVARHLHRTLGRRREHSFAGFLQEYDAHHALVGRRIAIVPEGNDPAITGRCEGLDSTGRLLIRGRGRLYRAITGHVVVR